MRCFSFSLMVAALLQAGCSYAGQPLNTEALDAQQRFLQKSVVQTQFSAVVRVYSVSSVAIANSPNMVWHIYRAEIITPIRGRQRGDISYAMAVEKGEETVIPEEPVLLTLCVNNDDALVADFYWPGTGAEFVVTPALIQVAQLAAASSDKGQSQFAMCD